MWKAKFRMVKRPRVRVVKVVRARVMAPHPIAVIANPVLLYTQPVSLGVVIT